MGADGAERVHERSGLDVGVKVKIRCHLVCNVAVHLRDVPVELVGIDAPVNWVR